MRTNDSIVIGMLRRLLQLFPDAISTAAVLNGRTRETDTTVVSQWSYRLTDRTTRTLVVDLIELHGLIAPMTTQPYNILSSPHYDNAKCHPPPLTPAPTARRPYKPSRHYRLQCHLEALDNSTDIASSSIYVVINLEL